MKEDIERLAGILGLNYEQMHQKLKERYDGYHFTKNSPEVYNPFSLLKAFQQRKVTNYWFDSGTPAFLIRQLQHFKTDITALESLKAFASDFDQPTENMKSALPLLYQQVKVAGGRADMVVWMPDTTYVFELKVNGTAQQALAQIDQNSYAIPYQAEGRRVVKVGVKFNADTRVPEDWVIAE